MLNRYVANLSIPFWQLMFSHITRDIDYASLKKILSTIMPSQTCDRKIYVTFCIYYKYINMIIKNLLVDFITVASTIFFQELAKFIYYKNI